MADISPFPPNSTTIESRQVLAWFDEVRNIVNGISVPAAADLDWELVSSATASASSQIAFTDLSSTYFTYRILMTDIAPVTDSNYLIFQVSTDNGSTWQAGTNYSYNIQQLDTGDTAFTFNGSETGSGMILSFPVATQRWGNGTNESGAGWLDIYDPTSTDDYTRFNSKTFYTNEEALFAQSDASGSWRMTTAVNAVRIFFNVGNISTGNFRLYGVRDT